jgi:hypothetical protein
LDDCFADDLDDLRDDGVSEGSKAVHPRGNPMSHSTHGGFREPPTSSDSGLAFLSIVACDAFPDFQSREVGVGHRLTMFGSSFFPTPAEPRASHAIGVGHNPDSISSVPGIDGRSRNNKRPRGVAERFQVRKHIVEFHSDDSRNVLANDPSGSDFCNNAAHLRPEMTVIFRASSLPGVTEGLAREPSANKVG